MPKIITSSHQPEFQEFFGEMEYQPDGLFPDLGLAMRQKDIKAIELPVVPCIEFVIAEYGPKTLMVSWNGCSRLYLASALVKYKNKKHKNKIINQFKSYTGIAVTVTDVGYDLAASPASQERFLPLSVKLDHTRCYNGIFVVLDHFGEAQTLFPDNIPEFKQYPIPPEYWQSDQTKTH